MMKSLVIGGNGFIGSHLVDRLLAGGHAVRVFDRHPEAYRAPLAGVEYRYGSFDHRQDLAGALEGVNLVFHLANTTLPKTSGDDPAFDLTSNLLPTLALLEECARRGQRLVFTSSGGTVYGDSDRLPLAEDSPTHPVSAYGVTKLAVENYLFYFNHQLGLDYAVVRPSNAYGPRQNPAGIQGAIPVFLGKVLRGESIEIWGDGSAVRDYVYVEDLADGLFRAATLKSASRVFNLGSGQGHSLKDVIAQVEKASGLKASVKYQPARSFDVKAVQLDISRAGRELGWKPATTLEAGVARTWDFVKGLK